MDTNLLLPFAISLAIGFIIGAERESLKLHAKVKVLAGLRTFLFVTIWGFLSAVLETRGFSPFFVVSFGLCTMLIITMLWVRGMKQGILGMTTAVALLLSFLLGALSILLDVRVPLALGVIIALVLSFKGNFSVILGRLPRSTVLAAVQFAVLSAATLPFLPNEYIDPWHFLNPYKAWWVVVLISAISFAGYLLHLLLDNTKSILLTAAVGGLASSTAVTSSMAQLSKTTTLSNRLLLSGCVLTSTIAAVRVLITTTAFNQGMFKLLVGPIAAFIFVGAVCLWLAQEKRVEQNGHAKAVKAFNNPFQLKVALGFAVFFVIVAFLAKETTELFGSRGLLVMSVFAGLADIDAISISISQLFATATITAGQALLAVIFAFLSNMWVKFSIVALFGSRELRKFLLRYTLLITSTGLGISLLLSYFYFN